MASFKMLFIWFISFVIGGYSTTNITRLLKGNKVNVSDGKCYCSNCNLEIPLYNQIPIISYFLSRKKCKKCGVKIPLQSIFLEVTVPVLIITIAFIIKYENHLFVVVFMIYEIFKLGLVIIFGKREDSFLKEYLISIGISSSIFLVLTLLLIMMDSFFIRVIFK